MKKFLITVGLMLALVSGVFAQTYYYKYVETVNAETGARSKGSPEYETMYITFPNPIKSCYFSDEKGIQAKSGTFGEKIFKYMGEQNNLFTFLYNEISTVSGMMQANPNFATGTWSFDTPTYVSDKKDYYLYFSKDLKRINYRIYYPTFNSEKGSRSTAYWDNMILIYERTEPPRSPDKGPSTFY